MTQSSERTGSRTRYGNRAGATTSESLERVAHARSVAVVGVSETSHFAPSLEPALTCGAQFHFVHPRVDSVFGIKTHPDLRALADHVDGPIDIVYCAVGAERTVEVLEVAADLEIGGAVVVSSGFAEMGAAGAALQDRMVAAARRGGFAIVGPNGIGMINANSGLDLTILPPFDRRAGGLSAATHSGAMIEAIGAASWRSGGVGLNLLFSAGNEATTDVADYLDFFADDPLTRVIALAVEKIRRPDAFFAAARRCAEAGKPILALKLGRSERARRMAASHTGTLTGDTWVYDVAFKQAGILLAHDIDDLVDRAQFLEQLPPQRWTPVRGLAVLTATGGFAQLASDLGEQEHVDIPDLDRLTHFVEANIPGGSVPNPLDATAFFRSVEGLWPRIITEYASAPEVDTLLFASQLAEWDRRGTLSAREFSELCQSVPGKAAVLAPVAGNAAWWVDDFRGTEVGIGNGLRSCFKGLNAMATFKRLRPGLQVTSPRGVPTLDRPAGAPMHVAEGLMLPFADTMHLLASVGIPTAPFHLFGPDDPVSHADFDGPYVAKLADVAHRTELDAVRVNVAADELPGAVAELRAIAAGQTLPPTVAVQAMIQGIGEAFIGIQGDSELGPVVAFGLGGVFVELLKRVGGRMAPMTELDAAELIDEFSDTAILNGFRGAPAWNVPTLIDILVKASRLAAAGREWIDSIDINPLIATPEGFVAVDGLCLLRDV